MWKSDNRLLRQQNDADEQKQSKLEHDEGSWRSLVVNQAVHGDNRNSIRPKMCLIDPYGRDRLTCYRENCHKTSVFL